MERRRPWWSRLRCRQRCRLSWRRSASGPRRLLLFPWANPWLQRTGWADYLQGLPLTRLAALLDPPRSDEPVLRRWEQALERSLAEGRAAILREEISVFDQVLVNMFRDHHTTGGRPLITKLQARTYVRYGKSGCSY